MCPRKHRAYWQLHTQNVQLNTHTIVLLPQKIQLCVASGFEGSILDHRLSLRTFTMKGLREALKSFYFHHLVSFLLDCKKLILSLESN